MTREIVIRQKGSTREIGFPCAPFQIKDYFPFTLQIIRTKNTIVPEYGAVTIVVRSFFYDERAHTFLLYWKSDLVSITSFDYNKHNESEKFGVDFWEHMYTLNVRELMDMDMDQLGLVALFFKMFYAIMFVLFHLSYL